MVQNWARESNRARRGSASGLFYGGGSDIVPGVPKAHLAQVRMNNVCGNPVRLDFADGGIRPAPGPAPIVALP